MTEEDRRQAMQGLFQAYDNAQDILEQPYRYSKALVSLAKDGLPILKKVEELRAELADMDSKYKDGCDIDLVLLEVKIEVIEDIFTRFMQGSYFNLHKLI